MVALQLLGMAPSPQTPQERGGPIPHRLTKALKAQSGVLSVPVGVQP